MECIPCMTSRNLTTFGMPLGPHHLTTLPQGHANAIQVYQGDTTFILQHEIPEYMLPFVDDVPVKSVQTCYQRKDGTYKTIPDVETQVSMGAYRPYCKTLYWTCWSAVTFAIFALSCILRFCIYCVFCVFVFFACFAFQIPRAFCISDSLHFHASPILRTFRDPTQFVIRALAYLVGFVFPHISHSCIFRAWTCATARLLGIHCIPFACPVLILQGPLVRISLCFTRITSYMSLHSHLCWLISLCVYITSPLYV